jgi:hypothetical protein
MSANLKTSKALVRAAVRYSALGDKYSEILRYTVGGAFLGTPFRGSWQTGNTTARMRVDIARDRSAEEGIEYSRELLEYLHTTTVDRPGPLDELVDCFTELIHSDIFRFPVVCFYETRATENGAVLSKLPKDFIQTEVDENGRGIVCLNHVSYSGFHLLTYTGCIKILCMSARNRISRIGL